MAAFPYMPFYTSAYWSDTSHLTYEEHGVYLRLIMVYWEKGKPLPSSPDKLARILGITARRFERVWENLSGFFRVDGAALFHDRIELELAKVRAKSLKAKESALANAKRTPSERSTDAKRTQSETTANAERTPSYIDRDIDRDISIVITPNGVTPNKVLEEAVSGWNDLAAVAGLAGVQRLTEPRRRALKARLSEAGGIEGWLAMLERVRDSSFLTGGNDRGWRADFDFVVKESNFTKIMEGKYDRKEQLSSAQRAAKRILAEEDDDAFGEIFKSLPQRAV